MMFLAIVGAILLFKFLNVVRIEHKKQRIQHYYFNQVLKGRVFTEQEMRNLKPWIT